jgi:S1-C subfamily serine protease
VLAIGAALVAGAAAGAGSAALVGRSRPAVPAVPAVPATAFSSGTSAETAQSIIAKVEPALVDIHTTGTSSSTSSAFGNGSNPFGSSSSTTEAAGTGMIIRSDGLVLTNAHVLEGETAITVTLDGSTATHPATLVGEDAAKDIALIQVQGVSGLPTVTPTQAVTATAPGAPGPSASRTLSRAGPPLPPRAPGRPPHAPRARLPRAGPRRARQRAPSRP